MSAKNKKSVTGKLLLAVVILLLTAAGLFLLSGKNDAPTQEPESTTEPAHAPVQEEVPATMDYTWKESEQPDPVPLNEYMSLAAAGNYTGIYMEDGSDEPVTGILKIHLTNVSEKPIQYARIVMDVEGEEAVFSVTALPAGATAVLLEQNRMKYRDDVDYMSLPVSCEDLALFNGELSLREDKLEIQTLKGALNITNISGEDITETITLCYKGWQGDMYYGGIAYRIKLEGGLKAGELRQIMAEHYMDPGSKLVFVEIVG